jgi:hypothetical protein|tara:strand:+ start:67510 stop:68334 length:825 start_codon:yes stop_codon:yes gene_type:complete
LRYFFCVLTFLFAAEISLAQDTLPVVEETVVNDSIAKSEQPPVTYDTNSEQQPLSFNKETIEAYQADDDFNYHPKEEADNWWTQFLDWLSRVWNGFWNWVGNVWRSFWSTILGDAEGSTLWSFVINVLPYIILAILIAFVIWLFFKLNPGSKLLQSKAKPAVFFSEEEEIIKSRDIEKLIQKALQNKNYRLAVRYYYLLILKRLTDAELIAYEFDKTNSDYFAEITAADLNIGFRKATNLYDYIWYGNFTVTEADFSKAQNTFNQLEKRIPKTQ